MAQIQRVSLKKSLNSPKLIALGALIVACLLLYFLVKIFHHQENNNSELNETLSLPSIEQEIIASPEIEEEKEEPTPLPNKKKATKKIPPKPANEWQIIVTRPGDTLSSVFKRMHLSAQTLHAVIDKNPYAKSLSAIKINQRLQFLIRKKTLEKLIAPLSNTQFLVISRIGNKYQSEINAYKMDSHNEFVTATVTGSLYSTANRMHIPQNLIKQMIDLFNWEIDLARGIRAGDQFTLVYEGFFIKNKLVRKGDIVAVSYTTHGKNYKAIRHKRRDGTYDYYSAAGMSLKKAFARYPIQFSHISSTFSLSRRHPILHYERPHKGIDLAASIGTPIHATGDGRVESIGRQNAYGNMIKLVHNKNYSSIYGHMLKFQKGLSKGMYVKRGQVIGYVGQSGLATGPHCHYEFHVNNHPKNPTTVNLPRSLPISGRERNSFRANANKIFAQMKIYEEAHHAVKINKVRAASIVKIKRDHKINRVRSL